MRSTVSLTQVETGSAITWKYPSCVLSGEESVGEFYSFAVANNHQQADTGTKLIHLGRNSRSTLISKRLSAVSSVYPFSALPIGLSSFMVLLFLHFSFFVFFFSLNITTFFFFF